MTYQIDKIRRDITTLQTDKGLQRQVDSYFENDHLDVPAEGSD